MYKKIGFVLLLIIVTAVFIKADVPPMKGYVRVRTDFVVETKDDLSDYRFFLNFYGDLREVELKPNVKTTIPSVGGGARYSSAQFLAIPKTSLQANSSSLSNDEKNNLASAIRDKKVEGLIELGTHSFIQDVKTANRKKVVTPTYLVEQKDNSLEMTQQKKNFKKVNWFEEENQTNTIIASVFLSLSIIFGGVFVARKNSKRKVT